MYNRGNLTIAVVAESIKPNGQLKVIVVRHFPWFSRGVASKSILLSLTFIIAVSGYEMKASVLGLLLLSSIVSTIHTVRIFQKLNFGILKLSLNCFRRSRRLEKHQASIHTFNTVIIKAFRLGCTE